MIEYFLKFFRNLRSVFLFSKLSLGAEYTSTAFGYFWLLLKPMFYLISYYFVSYRVMKVEIKNHFLFMIAGLSVLNFTSRILSSGVNIIATYSPLLLNKTLKKEFYILSFVLSSIIISSPVFIASVVYGIVANGSSFALISLPFYFLFLIIISYFIASIIAIIRVFFHDLSYIIEMFMPIVVLMTPILYPIEKIQDGGIFYIFQLFNPFYIVISPYVSIVYGGIFPNLFQIFSATILTIICYLLYKVIETKTRKILPFAIV